MEAKSTIVRAPIPKWTQARSRFGAAVRERLPDAELESRRADLVAARLADLIERLTADAPPLHPEHVKALHGVLDATQRSEARR